AAGADFIRVNVHIGAVVADQGLVEGRARETLLLRRELGSRALLFVDLRVKHAAPLAGGDLVHDARDAFGRGAADALILSGAATGAEADPAEFARVKDAVPAAPLLVGSGASAENVGRFWPVCDGMIVGSSLKPGNDARAPVDPARAREFTGAVARLRRGDARENES
ncbi:MAG: phosphorybosylanthranilate isomerase, partial [Gemmatimonadetes bacterium]|nr:phosphorybosylanthranilate isomerase [Gemmatimonadota bacterium]